MGQSRFVSPLQNSAVQRLSSVRSLPSEADLEKRPDLTKRTPGRADVESSLHSLGGVKARCWSCLAGGHLAGADTSMQEAQAHRFLGLSPYAGSLVHAPPAVIWALGTPSYTRRRPGTPLTARLNPQDHLLTCAPACASCLLPCRTRFRRFAWASFVD